MMKLFYSNTSPYSRKVRLTILVKGLQEQVQMSLCNPFADVTELLKVNPLGKIPTLVCDDGQAIYDSPVICEYLDTLGRGDRLLPDRGAERWEVLRRQALADGIIDLSYNIVMERRRAQAEQSPACIDDWLKQIDRAMDQVEVECDRTGASFDLGQLVLICALEYLDFRIKDYDWRQAHPRTAQWLAAHAPDENIVATRPFDA